MYSTEDTEINAETDACQVGKHYGAGEVYIGRGDAGFNLRDVGSDVFSQPLSDRPRGWLGNPFVIESSATASHYDRPSITVVPTRAASVEQFESYFRLRVADDSALQDALRDLAGQTLGCWCHEVGADGPACHGDVIATVIEELSS